MSSKFVKKLKKELTRNPKKTAILAIGLGAAVYFWIPLVGKWMGWDQKATPKPGPQAAAAAPAAGSPAGSVSATPVAKGKTTPVRWNELVKQIEQDLLTAPAADLALAGDPFTKPKPQIVVEEESDKEETPPPVATPVRPPVEMTPERAGLVLTSTMSGRGGRWATICGRVLTVGQTIRVAGASDNAAGEAETTATGKPTAAAERGTQYADFVLCDVLTDHVVLTHGGKQFDLYAADQKPAATEGVVVIEPRGP